jgi:N-sulfoglucosamine sulfohydrolase
MRFILLLFICLSLAAKDRPNILFIHMEDMGCEIPAYGDSTQETPTLTKLAKDGIVFERVNVTAPSCAPSRGSLFTGLYPHQNGMWAFDKTHGFHYRKGVPTFVAMLKNAGYATGISYKTGVEPKDYVPFDRKYNYNKNALGHDPKPHQVSNCIDGFDHFLQNLPEGKPFYFQAQTNDTHTIWAPGFEPIRGIKSRKGINPIDPKSVKALPHWGNVKMDFKLRQYLAEYYGAIQRVDYFVDQVLKLLDKYGHTENTLVIFSSDHGPSDLFRGKTTSYEFGLRVPFIAKWPGITKPGQRSNALVSFVDIMPTFLEVAGIARPAYLPGKSIVPVLNGSKVQGDRRLLYSAYNSHTTREDLYWPARTINNGRYKLIHNLLGTGSNTRAGSNGANAKLQVMLESSDAIKALRARCQTPPEFELYDLESDPGELIDLSNNPEYNAVKEELQRELLSWRSDVVKDPFVDNAVLKDFTEEYYAHCKQWLEHNQKVGKKAMQKSKWHLDKSRWIPDWDPTPYKSEK